MGLIQVELDGEPDKFLQLGRLVEVVEAGEGPAE